MGEFQRAVRSADGTAVACLDQNLALDLGRDGRAVGHCLHSLNLRGGGEWHWLRALYNGRVRFARTG